MKELKHDFLWDLAIIALCILMALLLTACTGPETVTTVAPSTASAATAPETTTPETTAAPETTLPSRPSVEEYFSDEHSWQNMALFALNAEGTVSPHFLFERPLDGQSTALTEQERQLLPEMAAYLDEYTNWIVLRYTPEQIDEILHHCYGKNADQLDLELAGEFIYLEQTGFYYRRVTRNYGNRIDFGWTEDLPDGTVAMYYDIPDDPARNPGKVAILQPHETGYYILSDSVYYDNTGKTEEQIAMEELFRDSWYSRALACTYASPSELDLFNVFYCGFRDESHKPTNEEWALLKDQPGFNENYDLMRLPAAKINAVLTEYFGITLADIPQSGTDGLVYLPSTDCYYFMTTGYFGASGFLAGDITHEENGTVRMEYSVSKYSLAEGTEFVMTLMPQGDGYRILSNLPLSAGGDASPKTADISNLAAAGLAMGISLTGTAFLAFGSDLVRHILSRRRA